MKNKLSAIALLLSMMLGASPTFAFVTGTPVPTDSRIKTFVYNANDVYRLLTHYGYQMNLEFGDDEEIQTVSVGDRSGWQITPGENRVFIRAMEDKAQTNMTVITDKRSYQFDLYSAPPGQQGWDELVYVVRFYYPEDARGVQYANAAPRAMMTGFPVPPPMTTPPSMVAPMPMPAPMMPPMSMLPPPSLPAPMMMPPMASVPMAPLPPLSPVPPMPTLTPLPPMASMQQPPMMTPAPFSMPAPPSPAMPMAQPLTSPALPPVMPPMMASPQAMARPATPVPPVNVTRAPFGMIPPDHMAVAPPPRMPHPRAPFIANDMTEDAQSLASKYPQGSYRDPMLAPRQLPSLSMAQPPQADVNGYGGAYDVSPNGLPLPSTAPGGYIQF